MQAPRWTRQNYLPSAKHLCISFTSEHRWTACVFCTCKTLTGSFCHALTGTWRPAAQPRSLWGNSPVEPRAPMPAGDLEQRAQASPCPHSEQRRREGKKDTHETQDEKDTLCQICAVQTYLDKSKQHQQRGYKAVSVEWRSGKCFL